MESGQQTILTPTARISALHALSHTLEKRKPLDAAWGQDRHFDTMSPSDKGFAQLLAKTALRRLGQIDDVLKHFLDRPLPGKAQRIMHILQLGIVQLIWLETPPHAAVHSAVEMTKQLKMEKFSGLVNAVLKRAAREASAIVSAQDAVKLNTPGWLWDSWEKTYGANVTRKIAEMHLREPPLDITVKSEPERWAKELGGTLLPLGSVRLKDARNITHLPGFAEGRWWVQDVAATIPARLLGKVEGKRVIDLCAAPGGKTAQLATAGAQVSAVDQSRERLAMLKTNVHRLRLQAEYIATDASKWMPEFAPEAILLDAPCSGTGTIRRHPDIAQLKTQEDVARLVEIQKKLLHHALDMLKPGGTLVYAVCSLQPEEGEMQIDALLKERKDVALVPVNPSLLGGMNELLTKRGEVRTLPCHLEAQGGMDGFYAAVLTKKGA